MSTLDVDTKSVTTSVFHRNDARDEKMADVDVDVDVDVVVTDVTVVVVAA